MKPKRILFINHNAGSGGSEQSLYDLCFHLDKLQFELYLAVPERGPLLDNIKALGIQAIVLPHLSWRWYYPGLVNKIKFTVLLPYTFFLLLRWYLFLKKKSSISFT